MYTENLFLVFINILDNITIKIIYDKNYFYMHCRDKNVSCLLIILATREVDINDLEKQ